MAYAAPEKREIKMAAHDSEVRADRASAIELRTLVLLGLAWGFAYWDRMSITFLSPYIIKDLHLTNFELSALPAALAFTWAIGAYLIGFWSDRVGARKPFLLAAIVVFSLCSVLSGLATSFPTLFAARLIMGLVEGPFLPICLAILTAVTAEKRRGLNAGITQNVFGSVMGTTLAPLALVGAGRCLLLARGVLPFGRTGPDPCAADLVAGGRATRPTVSAAQMAKEPSDSIRAMLSNRNIALCCGISVLMVGSLVIGSIFLPTYITGPLGMSPTAMSWIMSILGFCPAVGGVLVTWISDRIGRRPAMIGFCALLALCPVAALLMHGSVVVMTALMSISWVGAGSFPLFMGVVPAETLSLRRAATAMGLVIGVGEIGGGVLSPLIAGKLADVFSLTAPLIFQTVIPLVAAVLALGLRETNPRFVPSAAGSRA